MTCFYPCKNSVILIDTYNGRYEPSVEAYHYNTKVISIYVDDDSKDVHITIDIEGHRTNTTKRVIIKAINQFCENSIEFKHIFDTIIDMFFILYNNTNNSGYTDINEKNIKITLFY